MFIVQKSSQPYSARRDGACNMGDDGCSGPVAAWAVKLQGRFILCSAHVAELRG